MRVVCLGDPVVDILGDIDRDALDNAGLAEGGCEAVDWAELKRLTVILQLEKPLTRHAILSKCA